MTKSLSYRCFLYENVRNPFKRTDSDSTCLACRKGSEGFMHHVRYIRYTGPNSFEVVREFRVHPDCITRELIAENWPKGTQAAFSDEMTASFLKEIEAGKRTWPAIKDFMQTGNR